MKLRVLVVDDEPSLRELIILLIESSVDIQAMEAGCGLEAIEILKKQDFDAVLCDYNMPNGNGQIVFDFVQTLETKPYFILVTSESPSDVPAITKNLGVGYVAKPFGEKELVAGLRQVYKPSESYSPVEDYVALSLRSIKRGGPFEFDLYVKIGPSRYVKYFNAGHAISEADEERLIQKKIDELHAPRTAVGTFIERLQRSAFDSIVLKSGSLDHAFEMADLMTDFTKLGLQGLVSNPEILKLTEQNLKTVFAITEKVEVMKDLLRWVQDKKSSVSKLHSVGLNLICNVMLESIDLGMAKDRASMLLSYASVLHDIGLEEYFVKNEWRISQGIKTRSSMNKYDREYLGAHVEESESVAKSWSNCPPEVLKIIAEHHEWPDGKGFPKGLTAQQISPLSAVFIMSHEVISMLFEHKSREAIHQALDKLLLEVKGYPQFSDPLNNLKKIL